MSVQLIVYPQGHNGRYNAFSNPDTDFIVNGSNFTGLGNAPAISNYSIYNAIFLNPATVPNSWYRYAYPDPVTPPIQYPSESNGNCVIPNSSTAGYMGIYQRVTGLTAGINYDLIIDIVPPSTPNNGTIKIVRRNTLGGAFFTTNHAIDETTTRLRIQIGTNAQGQLYDETIFVGYKRSNSSSTSGCTIGRIQLQPAFGLQGSILLDDGQVICDLYEDEDLPLTLSVDEFKNVAEKPQSYSKAFNLPATKRNNRIFDHIFEITRHLDGGSPQFNPYQKTQCVLKQDGLLIFQGYLRMLDIVDKEGEISYNVNLYSEVIALADLLKDKKFSDLDFTELEHDYDRLNIERSNNNGTAGQTTPITYLHLSTSGFRTNFNTVKYPFIDWTGNLTIANGSTNATSGFTELNSLEQAFRPCINIKYLIDMIFAQSDIQFTYTSDFFNTTEFSELFMDFNWGGDNIPSAINETYLARWNFNVSPSIPSNIGNNSFKKFHLIPETITPSQAPSALPPNYDPATNILTATTNNEIYDITYNFLLGKTSATSESIECQWLHTVGGVVQPPINQQTIFFPAPNTIKSYTGTLQIALQTGDTLSAQFKGDTDIRQNEIFSSTCAFVQSSATILTTTLQVLRGELGQWEFLKGLINMFNLVTIPDKDNPDNIIIEPYVDTFINNTSNELNWTDKIDISEMKLEPLTDLNRNTLFKYVEDEDDYAFQTYKEATSGFLYGSLEYDANNAQNDFNILEGTKEIEASPFAATVIKSVEPVTLVNFVTPAMYSMNDYGRSEPFDNSPRIFYNRGLTGGVSYYIPAQNGVGEEQATLYGYFSHLRKAGATLTGARDLNFGLQQLFPNVAGGTINNLYNLYWADYFNELYNINTRIMTIKVNLTPADINTFKFNQRVFIKNRLFRVNRIDYKPNDLSTVEFILLPSSGDARDIALS
jgi:hypothetical protein